MGAGWMCMVVLTIRLSLSSERRHPVPKGRENAEPRPVRDVCDDEKTRSIIRAENRIPTVLSELTRMSGHQSCIPASRE